MQQPKLTHRLLRVRRRQSTNSISSCDPIEGVLVLVACNVTDAPHGNSDEYRTAPFQRYSKPKQMAKPQLFDG